MLTGWSLASAGFFFGILFGGKYIYKQMDRDSGREKGGRFREVISV